MSKFAPRINIVSASPAAYEYVTLMFMIIVNARREGVWSDAWETFESDYYAIMG